MVECARLEIVYTGNRIKGSNPFFSARYNKNAHLGVFIISGGDEGGQTLRNLYLAGGNYAFCFYLTLFLDLGIICV